MRLPSPPVAPVMWISRRRVLYAGLLGRHTPHALGATIVYVAIEQPLELRIGGGAWLAAEAAVVPPGVTHQVRSSGRMVGTLLIEPEALEPLQLRERLGTARGVLSIGDLPERFRALCVRLSFEGASAAFDDDRLDCALFGQPLGERTMDARIDRVVRRIREHPCAGHAAGAAAEASGLSTSRFLHLFKAEVGVPFRAFRTWKRARELLHHANRRLNLAHFALDSGYPDSTHFSHTVRRIFGMSPRDLFAGSRRLAIYSGDARA